MREGTPRTWRDAALLILTVLAVLVACVQARDVLVPIAVAFTLQGLLSPFVRSMARRGVPRPIGALGVLLVLTGIAGTAIYSLAGPAATWLSELPRTSAQVSERLSELRAPVERVAQAAEQVEGLASAASGSAAADEGALLVVQQEGSLFETARAYVAHFGVSSFIVLALLFLLLANEGGFLRNLQGTLASVRDRRVATCIVLSFQYGLSTYLISVTLINAILGLVIGLALWRLGVPNPVLWGVMAGALNFVPYLGTTVGIGVVALVSLVTFDSLGQALLPPLAYLLLSGIEGTVLTPFLVGSRLTLNPVGVFLSVILWGFVWGIAGAMLAVPILMATMLLCKQVPQLRPLGELLSDGAGPPSGRGALARPRTA